MHAKFATLTLKSLVVAKVNDKHKEPQNALQYTDTSLKHLSVLISLYEYIYTISVMAEY